MSFTPDMNRLSLDQAPPLSIPASFFLTAPIAVMGAGALLLDAGASPFFSNWLPTTLGLTHLGTLGFLAMVMMGALYQMTPVVAAAPVPAIRLAHLVHALLAFGVLRLVLGLTNLWPGGVFEGFATAALAGLLFLGTVGVALARTETTGETVASMRLALGSFFLVLLLGFLMSQGFRDGSFPGTRNLWVQVHLSIAFLGWVGGLLTGVSWQVVPMFYLTTPTPPAQKKLVFHLILIGVVLSLTVLFIDLLVRPEVAWWNPGRFAAIAALPAVASAWLLHPHITFHALRKRRRKRADASLWFWQAGLIAAPLCVGVALAAHLFDDARPTLLLGWLLIWGWAGMIIHGMLSRIFPFLVWFHRFSPYVGRIRVPAMRNMLPNRWTQIGFGLHLAALLVGALAILTGSPWLARSAGLLLLATGVSMLYWMIHLLRQFPDLSGLDVASNTAALDPWDKNAR